MRKYLLSFNKSILDTWRICRMEFLSAPLVSFGITIMHKLGWVVANTKLPAFVSGVLISSVDSDKIALSVLGYAIAAAFVVFVLKNFATDRSERYRLAKAIYWINVALVKSIWFCAGLMFAVGVFFPFIEFASLSLAQSCFLISISLITVFSAAKVFIFMRQLRISVVKEPVYTF